MAIDKNSNKYIIGYAGVMIVIVALVLSVVSISLQDRQHANVLLEKQANILASVGIPTHSDDRHISRGDFVRSQFDRYIIDSYVVDGKGERIEDENVFGLLGNLRAEFARDVADRRLPIFVARTDSQETLYIFPVFGRGLWGAIWGYIALHEDFNTIYGVNFDHSGETPGLGAEISTPAFWDHFTGKQIFDANGNFVSIAVLRGTGGSVGNINAVDGISGGTITSHGVQVMLLSSLGAYLPVIERGRMEFVARVGNESDTLINITNNINIEGNE